MPCDSPSSQHDDTAGLAATFCSPSPPPRRLYNRHAERQGPSTASTSLGKRARVEEDDDDDDDVDDEEEECEEDYDIDYPTPGGHMTAQQRRAMPLLNRITQNSVPPATDDDPQCKTRFDQYERALKAIKSSNKGAIRFGVLLSSIF